VGTPAWKTRVGRRRILDVERRGSVEGEETKGITGGSVSEQRIERQSSGEGEENNERKL
jgi:hypothetical protein